MPPCSNPPFPLPLPLAQAHLCVLLTLLLNLMAPHNPTHTLTTTVACCSLTYVLPDTSTAWQRDAWQTCSTRPQTGPFEEFFSLPHFLNLASRFGIKVVTGMSQEERQECCRDAVNGFEADGAVDTWKSRCLDNKQIFYEGGLKEHLRTMLRVGHPLFQQRQPGSGVDEYIRDHLFTIVNPQV